MRQQISERRTYMSGNKKAEAIAVAEILKLLSLLPEEKKQEIFWMSEGARIVAEKSGAAA